MPIPKPESGEAQEKFHSRCITAIYDEYKDKDNGTAQANAICFQQWRDHHAKVLRQATSESMTIDEFFKARRSDQPPD